jgi:hypothetical protein
MVYVDDMYRIPLGEFRGMKMSHLIADSKEELLNFVDKIGVKRKWIQHENDPLEHFDICLSKRELAIKVGATPITMREMSKLITKRKDDARNTAILADVDNTSGRCLDQLRFD